MPKYLVVVVWGEHERSVMEFERWEDAEKEFTSYDNNDVYQFVYLTQVLKKMTTEFGEEMVKYERNPDLD